MGTDRVSYKAVEQELLQVIWCGVEGGGGGSKLAPGVAVWAAKRAQWDATAARGGSRGGAWRSWRSTMGTLPKCQAWLPTSTSPLLPFFPLPVGNQAGERGKGKGSQACVVMW